MPPPSDAGLRFLQRAVEYAEHVIFVNGRCSCGALTVDFTVEAQLAAAPRVGQTPAVEAYIFECLGCHNRHTVPLRIFEEFLAHPPQPPKPPVDRECVVCHRLVPDNTMQQRAIGLTCRDCIEVAEKLGLIMGVEEAPLM